jgi:acetyltransferase
MTGSDEVYDAAFRRCGVLRVDTIAELFHMAEVLGKQPRPRGPKLMILTNAGGPGVLATDALMAGGGDLALLSKESEEALSAFLPAHWSHANPIDILGDADPERYARTLEIASQDPNSDGLLAILAPQGMTDPAEVADKLKVHAKQPRKPVLASWMGGQGVQDGINILNAAGIPTFSYPDSAVRSFRSMWNYTYNLRGLYETPFPADDPAILTDRKERVGELIAAATSSGRMLLTELESKNILKLYGISTVPTSLATNEESSVVAKSGRNAFLGVTVQPMVRSQGYELILGSTIDAQFGPVILFGSGGQLVEVYRDRALALPPLNTTLAERLVEQTKILKALRGVRGRKPVDLDVLKTLLVRFSELVVEQPRLREVDINPVFASSEQLLALDARMVLFAGGMQDSQLPQPAIRPYPAQYISRWKRKDGSDVTIRPIRPEDEPLMVAFHETLSDSSVYLRYFHVHKLDSRVAHERLIRKCCVDYDREIALVAMCSHPESGVPEILAVGRLTRQLSRDEAELGILVSDRCQGEGLGKELVARLLQIARAEKIHTIVAHILSENAPMLALARRFHFESVAGNDPASRIAILKLS